MYRERADNYGYSLTKEEIEAMSADARADVTLAPYHYNNLQEHREWAATKFNCVADRIYVDLEQQTGYSTVGRDIPALAQRSVIASVNLDNDRKEWRVASGEEHLAMQGMHMFAGYPHSKLASHLRRLDDHEQRRVAGNGMHLATQSSFMIWILANVSAK